MDINITNKCCLMCGTQRNNAPIWGWLVPFVSVKSFRTKHGDSSNWGGNPCDNGWPISHKIGLEGSWCYTCIYMCTHMGVSWNGGPLWKWMVYTGNSCVNWIIWGYPYFRKPQHILVGGIPTPLKNMKVSWDDYSQYMEN